MLSNFENQTVFNSFNLKGVKNWWDFSFELNIYNGTDNLRDLAFFLCYFLSLSSLDWFLIWLNDLFVFSEIEKVRLLEAILNELLGKHINFYHDWK